VQNVAKTKIGKKQKTPLDVFMQQMAVNLQKKETIILQNNFGPTIQK
jgi:hypothetical protein